MLVIGACFERAGVRTLDCVGTVSLGVGHPSTSERRAAAVE
jgi:hypothetical protein